MPYLIVVVLILTMQNCSPFQANKFDSRSVDESKFSQKEIEVLLEEANTLLFEVSLRPEPEARFLAQLLAADHGELFNIMYPGGSAVVVLNSGSGDVAKRLVSTVKAAQDYLSGNDDGQVLQLMGEQDRGSQFQPENFKKLTTLAVAGQDLTVPVGEIYYIDGDIDVNLIHIDGELRCLDSGSYKIRTQGVIVSGKFVCGSASKRFAGQLDIAIKPGRSFNHHTGESTFSVMSGGVWSFYGDSRNSKIVHLNGSASAGSNTIQLSESVSWGVGDEIAIGPTSFNHLEAEKRIISNIHGTTITLNQALNHSHWGKAQSFTSSSQNWTLDHRAEVVNLTRNIKIYTDGVAHRTNYLGAHSMVMRGGSAYIDSVEFQYMGRMGEMARYPFHWHLAGDVRGQFIANSSIHDSYQRCVTVHGTNNALVQNNICYNHFGHGFFLEHGNEERNLIVGNLGMLSKRPPAGKALLQSDITGDLNRFSPPATFWISNPNNYVVGNISSGSAGSGFWMAFHKALKCTAFNCEIVSPNDPGVTHRPLETATWAFSRNTAHTNDVGVTWDGSHDGGNANNPNNSLDTHLVSAHYSPPTTPVFDQLTMYKSRRAGAYFRGATAKFRSSVFADNRWSAFFAYNQIIENSIIVGRSENYSFTDDNYLKQGPKGVVVYDGPFELDNVHFANFSVTPEIVAGANVTSIPFFAIGGANRFINQVRRISFSPEPLQRMTLIPLEGLNWGDSLWSMSIRDVNGSLTGSPGKLIVPDHPFMSDSRCVRKPSWQALSCQYDVGLLAFRSGTSPNYTPFVAIRSDGQRTIASIDDIQTHPTTGPLHNKVNLILTNYEYTMEFPENYQRPNDLYMYFQSEVRNKVSPVIKLEGFGYKCRFEGGTSVASLAALRASQGQTYYASGNDFYVKLRAYRGQPGHVSPTIGSSTTHPLKLDCEGDVVDRGIASPPPEAENPVGIGSIKGHIDSIALQGTSAIVKGWACYAGANQSIDIHLYAGGPAATGTLIKSARANVVSEAAVSTACGTSGVSHRFQIEVTAAELKTHGGKSLYIHGIRPSGATGSNLLIAKSGDFNLPTMGPVIGFIDGVGSESGKTYVVGWACYKGYEAPISVHIYVGGPAATGTLLKGVVANQSAEIGVANACGTSRAAHRFKVEITAAELAAHSGKSIYVHGINPAGLSGENLLINKSGTHSIP